MVALRRNQKWRGRTSTLLPPRSNDPPARFSSGENPVYPRTPAVAEVCHRARCRHRPPSSRKRARECAREKPWAIWPAGEGPEATGEDVVRITDVP